MMRPLTVKYSRQIATIDQICSISSFYSSVSFGLIVLLMASLL